MVTTVHVGIVNQPFPANGGAGFFKVDPHDQKQLILNFPCQHPEALSVFKGGIGIMDRAGADDNHQTTVTTVDNVL